MDTAEEQRPAIYAFAQEVWRYDKTLVTTHQLHALQLWSQGAGYKRIGMALGISRDSARGRVDRALSAIKRLEDSEAA